MDAAASSEQLHVVICPWLAFGHLLPFLELAERLAQRGHRVSYVATPATIARLPPVRAPTLEFVALPFPRDEGLPEGAESTNDVPFEKWELHWKAFDGLAAPFAEFLRAACADGGRRPHWLVVDAFHHWAAAAALECKVPSVLLIISSANIVVATWGSRRVEPAEPSGRTKKLSNGRDAVGKSIFERCSLVLERCTVVAMRSCLEWEPESVPQASTLKGKPVIPLGLLLPAPDRARLNGEADDATLRWLDAQPASSVVYVALGSEVPLRVEQVHELALGLELAGTRFLWALRKPSGALDDADVLPPGFEDRTRGRGIVAMSWVPQIRILAHGAVGAFLTHCGWSSVIEGLQFGHPLIMLPFVGDAGPNARLMEDRKVGVQVPRDRDDGSFDRHGIANTVRAVMLEEETRQVLLANAKKLQEIASDRDLQESHIDRFIQQLRSHRI